MGRQGKVEGGAAVGRSFGPDAAGVAFNDAADVSEANARALEGPGSFEPMKDAEQLTRLGHIETNSIVADEKDDFARFMVGGEAADLDMGGFAVASEFERVGDEVIEGGAD